jgi:aminoglycoside phosphotransferase (APT) family kinase protein
LFLERVLGRELFQVGELVIWEAAARWLARFHNDFKVSINEADQLHLVEYNGDFYRTWIRRAVAFCRDPAAKVRLEWLAARYDRVVDRLLAMPVTMLHGEFYASNILVQETPTGLRICPVDWEMAALGPGPIDLAALIAGKWTEAGRLRIASAYFDELGACGSSSPVPTEIIDDCRLHLAVQWLGWSPNWSPPPEHRHDWLGEAMTIAERRIR